MMCPHHAQSEDIKGALALSCFVTKLSSIVIIVSFLWFGLWIFLFRRVETMMMAREGSSLRCPYRRLFSVSHLLYWHCIYLFLRDPWVELVLNPTKMSFKFDLFSFDDLDCRAQGSSVGSILVRAPRRIFWVCAQLRSRPVQFRIQSSLPKTNHWHGQYVRKLLTTNST